MKRSIFKNLLCIFMLTVLQVFMGLFAHAQSTNDDYNVIYGSIKKCDILQNGGGKWISKYAGHLVGIETTISCGDLKIPARVRYVEEVMFPDPATEVVCNLILVYRQSTLHQICKKVGVTLPTKPCHCTVQIKFDEGAQFEFEDNLDFRRNYLDDILRTNIILYYSCGEPMRLSKELFFDSAFLSLIK